MSYLTDSRNPEIPLFYVGGIGTFSSKEEVLKYIATEYLPRQKKKASNAGYDPALVSYSVWEYIHGTNYTVVMDDGNPEIFFVYKDPHRKCIISRVSLAEADETERMLIAEYQNIQKMGIYGSHPIIELQHKKGSEETTQDAIYTLQSLPLKDRETQHLPFTLDRPREAEEMEALFVRGTTPPEGIIIDLPVFEMGRILDGLENGIIFSSFTISDYPNLIESIIGQFDCQIVVMMLSSIGVMAMGKNISSLDAEEIMSIIRGHAGVSFMHKPKLSLVLPEPFGILDDTDTVRIHITSDGKKAYAKFV